MDNKIMIKIDGENAELEMQSPIAILDLLQVLGSVQYNAMVSFIDQVPEEHREAVKEDLYDKYNFMASNILEKFGPEFDLRKDLTAQAILEAENNIIDREYEKMAKKKGKKKKC